MIEAKKDKYIFFLTLLTLAAFLILKMQRGFTASEDQGGIWNIIQGLYVVYGLYICVIIEREYLQFAMIKCYMVFMFTMWFFSSFVIYFSPNWGISTLFHFITIPYGFLCFMVFYWLGLKNDIRKYPYILYFTFVIIIYILFVSMRTFYFHVSEDKGAVADVYYIVGLLPIIFIYTPKKFRVVPFLLTCIAVMMTGKRTGFLALVTIFIFYFLPNDFEKRKSFFIRIILFVILLIIVYFVITQLTTFFDLRMFDRLSNLSEDGGSGRAERWANIWNSMCTEDDIIPLFVGYGYDAVIRLVGGHAHNDFLEILYNYGIIVLGLYVAFFITMIVECIKMYKLNFVYAREFMVAIVVSMFLAMFSFYVIDCTHITCCSVCLGLILAEWFKYKNEITYE